MLHLARFLVLSIVALLPPTLTHAIEPATQPSIPLTPAEIRMQESIVLSVHYRLKTLASELKFLEPPPSPNAKEKSPTFRSELLTTNAPKKNFPFGTALSLEYNYTPNQMGQQSKPIDSALPAVRIYLTVFLSDNQPEQAARSAPPTLFNFAASAQKDPTGFGGMYVFHEKYHWRMSVSLDSNQPDLVKKAAPTIDQAFNSIRLHLVDEPGLPNESIVKRLAEQMLLDDFFAAAIAISDAQLLIERQPPRTNMACFKPLIAPLFKYANYGGIARQAGKSSADSLTRIGSLSIPYLQEQIDSKESHDRWSAMKILHRIGEPKSILASGQSLLDDPDTYVRINAITSLTSLGKDATPALKALETALDKEQELPIQQKNETEHARIRLLLLEALTTIDGPTKGRLDALTDLLDPDSSVDIAAFAADQLAQLGPAAKPTLPALRIASDKHPSESVRKHAGIAIEKISLPPN